MLYTLTSTVTPPMNTTATHAVLHSQSSWPQQGFLTQSVMSTISTLSLSHTHTAYVTIHTHTQDWSYLQESLHPIHLKDSDTHRTSSLSTIPRNQGCHRHVHTHTPTHTTLPSITRSHQAIIVPPTDIYSVSVTHVICVTQTVAIPPAPTQTLTSSYALGAPTGLPVQNPPSSVPCFQ